MAYLNPEVDAKSHRMTLRLDRKQRDLIRAIAANRGEQPAALAREMLMAQVDQVADELCGRRPQAAARVA